MTQTDLWEISNYLELIGARYPKPTPLFSTATDSKTRSNGYKLQEGVILVLYQEEILDGKGSYHDWFPETSQV